MIFFGFPKPKIWDRIDVLGQAPFPNTQQSAETFLRDPLSQEECLSHRASRRFDASSAHWCKWCSQLSWSDSLRLRWGSSIIITIFHSYQSSWIYSNAINCLHPHPHPYEQHHKIIVLRNFWVLSSSSFSSSSSSSDSPIHQSTQQV